LNSPSGPIGSIRPVYFSNVVSGRFRATGVKLKIRLPRVKHSLAHFEADVYGCPVGKRKVLRQLF
jgi:hypothetical protein